MGYHIRRDENVQSAVRRVASEQIRDALRDIREEVIDRHEVVHLLRKRCKKLRGLARLVRPWLGETYYLENAFFRDLSRELSFVRDSQALVEAYDRLLEHVRLDMDLKLLPPVRARLTQMPHEMVGDADALTKRLVPVIEQLEQAALRVEAWVVEAEGFDALEDGLIKTYGRARRAQQTAEASATSQNFHEWRKRVKYHWHHSRLLRNVSPRLMKPHRRMAAELGELLGRDHDLAVLHERLEAEQSQFGSVQQVNLALRVIRQRQSELQAAAKGLGRRLLAERPRCLAERWRVYWGAWDGDRDETSASLVSGPEL